MKPKNSYRYTFSLVLVDNWGLSRQRDLVSPGRKGVEDLVEVFLSEEAVECIPE